MDADTNKPNAGFQLMEILIVLVIVSIVATFALPFYSQYLVASQRQEAAASLTRLAVAMEQYHAEHNSYEGATLAKVHFPEMVAKNNYRVSINVANASEYVLAAEPLGKQAEQDKNCGNLILSNIGEKSISGTRNISECWL